MTARLLEGEMMLPLTPTNVIDAVSTDPSVP
jgi:hypothetical protein